MKATLRRVAYIFVLVCLIAGMFEPLPVQAENTVTLIALESPYFQDFNTLSSNNESDTLPTGWILSEKNKNPDQTAETNANNKYRPNSGAVKTGDTYSFGSVDSTDRALGGIQDNIFQPLFGASFTNYTGGIIESLDIQYTGEEWRAGKLTYLDKISFEFSTDATSLESGTWEKIYALDFFTPNVYVVGSKDGNSAENREVIKSTISDLHIDSGMTFWIRWIDYDVYNKDDDGLAVDDFSLVPHGSDFAPTLVSITPADNTTNVALDANLTFSFSEAVNLAEGWVTLSCSKSKQHTASITGGPLTFTMDPNTDFAYGDICSIFISSEKVTDQDSADLPDALDKDYSFSFSTILPLDDAPTITDSSLAKDSQSVSVDKPIELTFSEPVAIGSGAINITCKRGGPFSLSISGGPEIYQIIHDPAFKYSDDCLLSIYAQKITDLDLNDPEDNMLMDQTIHFTTEKDPDVIPDTAPEITETKPAKDTINVDVKSNIIITFSERVTTTDQWAELKCSISGDHSFTSTQTEQSIKVIPDKSFANNESCTMTIFASQISDQDADDPPFFMAKDYSFSFSTAPYDDKAPTVINTYPADQAIDIPISEAYKVTFSEPVFLMNDWVEVACSKSKNRVVTIDSNIEYKEYTFESFNSEEPYLNYSEKCVITLKSDKIYDLDTNDPPDFMAEDFSFTFTTEKSPEETNIPTILDDEKTYPNDGDYVYRPLNHLSVKFNKDIQHDGGNYAANNVNNYFLIEYGINKLFETSVCGKLEGDDTLVPIDSVTYDTNLHVSTLFVNHGANLPDGTYRLIVCGDHTLKDLYNNPLNNGLNSTITFTLFASGFVEELPIEINPPANGIPSTNGTLNTNTPPGTKTSRVPLIPVTGFRQGEVTLLKPQPSAYKDMGDLWLEIPTLEVEISITGVPKKNDNWDVTWLGNNIGWLEGSALPGLVGNSVLTAHVWDATNQPGPFYGLEKLQYGDQVILHAWGELYTYEVREVLSVKPENVNAMVKHQEKAWLTLVTCQGYDEDNGDYQHRILVRAVLVEVR